MVREVTDKDFDKFIKDYDIVLIDIYAEWCAPCKIQARIIDQVIEQLELPHFGVAKVDVDKAPDVADRFDITAIPTLLLFKDGQLAKKHIGVWRTEQLLAEIKAL